MCGNKPVYTSAGIRRGSWPMSVDVCMKDKAHFLVYFLMLMKFCMWLCLEQESKGVARIQAVATSHSGGDVDKWPRLCSVSKSWRGESVH